MNSQSPTVRAVPPASPRLLPRRATLPNRLHCVVVPTVDDALHRLLGCLPSAQHGRSGQHRLRRQCSLAYSIQKPCALGGVLSVQRHSGVCRGFTHLRHNTVTLPLHYSGVGSHTSIAQRRALSYTVTPCASIAPFSRSSASSTARRAETTVCSATRRTSARTAASTPAATDASVPSRSRTEALALRSNAARHAAIASYCDCTHVSLGWLRLRCHAATSAS